jgi:hypothetical protein
LGVSCLFRWVSLVAARTVTTLGMSSPSDEAARPEGTVDVLLRRPRVTSIWKCGVAVVWLPRMASRRSLIVSGVGWDDGG